MSAREKVLDAFEELLLNDGERGATLDAVAAQAAVSKGGVLYHFKNKDALVQGLTERLSDLTAVDTAAMSADPRGPSAYYVDTSVYDGSAIDRALIATARLAQEAHPVAREALANTQRAWYELIEEEVGTRAVARAILLLGDGLYYNAVLTDQVANTQALGSGAADRAQLLEVVAMLKDQAAARERAADTGGPH